MLLGAMGMVWCGEKYVLGRIIRTISILINIRNKKKKLVIYEELYQLCNLRKVGDKRRKFES